MARAVGDGAKVVSAAIRHEKEERQRRPLRLVRFCGEVGSKRRSEESTASAGVTYQVLYYMLAGGMVSLVGMRQTTTL